MACPERSNVETWRPIPPFEGFEASDLGRIRSWWRESRTAYVHQLVALTFLGVRPDGQGVRHLDGSRRNNALSNLAYGTVRENWEDHKAHAPGAWSRPEYLDAVNAALGACVRSARIERGLSAQDVASRIGVSQNYLYCVERGENQLSLHKYTELAACLQVSVARLLAPLEPAHA